MRIFTQGAMVAFADDEFGNKYKLVPRNLIAAEVSADGTRILLRNRITEEIESPGTSYLLPSSFKNSAGFKYATSDDGTTAATSETLEALSTILGFSSGGGGGAVWGSISGDITAQSDLAALLENYGKVEWFDTFSFFPPTGLADTFYIARDTGIVYTWDVALEVYRIGRQPTDNYVEVYSPDQLPPRVGDVITLEKSIIIRGDIDLLGARINSNGKDILGKATNKSSLTSTGLNPALPLITFVGNCVLANLKIHNVGLGFVIDDAAAAYDWTRVNFENCTQSGIVGNCLFLIVDTMAFINAPALTFNGTIISFVASPNCIWRGLVGAGTQIIFSPTFVATARVRIQDSQIQTPTAGQIGIDFQSGASVPISGLILDKVLFSLSGGTPIQGITGTNDRANFQNCRGLNVINSGTNFVARLVDNVTPTTIVTQNVFEPIAGAFIQGIDTQRFTVAANGVITCNDPVNNRYLLTATFNVVSSNNQTVIIKLFRNDVEITEFKAKETTDGLGRVDSMVFIATGFLAAGEYIQLKVANTTSTASVTVQDATLVCIVKN